MNRIIFPYDESYYPPFPALPVVIQNSEIGAQTAVIPALLDSGADGTMVPLPYLRDIQAPVLQETRIRSHWGEWRTVTMFLVDIKIGGLTLAGVFVVGDESGGDIVLGRNVLSKIRLELDGPASKTILPSQ